MKIYRLLLGLGLLSALSTVTLEKPETPDINPETKGIEQDIKSIKAEEKVINTLETHANKATKLVNTAVTNAKDWYNGASQADITELEALATRIKEKAQHIKSTLKNAQYDLKARFRADLNKLSHELNQIGN